MSLPQQPISSPFGAKSEARDVIRDIDLSGKTAIVTGAAAGLGLETARALAGAGARVIMPVRTRDKGERAVQAIRLACPNAQVELANLDLGDLDSVRAFADSFIATGVALDMLINNAGIMATPERRIMGNIEAQFGTNHLGHMLLACRLAPALLKADTSCVVALSSLGHRRSSINFEDPNFERRPYDKWLAYGQAKTANALFAVELNRRLEGRGVRGYAVHPGAIMTELQRDLSRAEMQAFGWIDEHGKVNEYFKTAAGGAATAAWCATSPLLRAGGGVYCEDCNIAKRVDADEPRAFGVRPWAIDPEAASRLWSLSETLLGEPFQFQ